MAAERSIGTTLTYGDGNTAVANLTSIGEIGIESNEIDVTTLDSDSGYKEFIAGFKDAGEMSLAGTIKDETNMESLLGLADDQDVVTWVITTPSGSVWTFDGFLKSFKEGEVTVEGVRTFTGSIRISGKPDYEPGEGVSA